MKDRDVQHKQHKQTAAEPPRLVGIGEARHCVPKLDWFDRLTQELMAARRAVGVAKRSGDAATMKAARAAVDVAKVALGERGPVWWSDGSSDFNRHMAKNTPYADWFAALS